MISCAECDVVQVYEWDIGCLEVEVKMKKGIPIHSNVFDSTHQREIKSIDNVFGKFLVNVRM